MTSGLEPNKQIEIIGRERIISLVFGLLGVVQGLAFTRLSERIPATFKSTEFNIINFSNIIYFAVGFFIVVRVFQTYSCGIVSYAQRRMKIWDLYSIFIAGLLQYWVFDSFGSDGYVDAKKLFFRVMCLSILAIILHSLVIASKKTPIEDRKNQKVNIGFGTGVLLVCLSAIWVENTYYNVASSITICIFLFFNTWYSINNTDFGTLS